MDAAAADVGVEAEGTTAVPAVPTPLTEPMVLLSEAQAAVVARLPELPTVARTGLPCWVPAKEVGAALGFGPEGVARAVSHVGQPYLWATEFENVHSLWRFDEPEIVVDGRRYLNSETYYHAQKPRPFSDADWDLVKSDVMERAVRAKLAAAPLLGSLLRATHPHPLLSIKPDKVWGFDPRSGGENRLAEIWMKIRAELIAAAPAPVAAPAPAVSGEPQHPGGAPVAPPPPPAAAAAASPDVALGNDWREHVSRSTGKSKRTGETTYDPPPGFGPAAAAAVAADPAVDVLANALEAANLGASGDAPDVPDEETAVLICFAPPKERATLFVDYNSHEARVSADGFSGYRWFLDVPHVAVLRGRGGVLNLLGVPTDVARELLRVPAVSAKRRMELLADHVSAAFQDAAVRDKIRVSALRAADGDVDGVRVEFDDLEAFMLAALRPCRKSGWLGVSLPGSPDRLAVPLIVRELEDASVVPPGGGDLIDELRSLLKRTTKAATNRPRFKNFFETLGPLLFYANPHGPLLPALAGELARVGGDVGGSLVRDVTAAAAAFCQSREAGIQRFAWKGRDEVAQKVRVAPFMREGPGICPIDAAEILRDVRSGSKIAVGLWVLARWTDGDGVAHRIRVKQVLRCQFTPTSSVGHAKGADPESSTPEEYMLALAQGACAEFAEEVGTHRPGLPHAEIRDGECYLHGEHLVRPAAYNLVKPGKRKPEAKLSFAVDFGDVGSVDDVAEKLFSGVPQDIGYESVGRHIKIEPIIPWDEDTAVAKKAVRAELDYTREHDGFALGVLLKFSLRPFCYPPIELVKLVGESKLKFSYSPTERHKEDRIFRPHPHGVA